MDKALNYLALARKANLAELGEEPVGGITRRGKGYLVVVASDAGDHTWRRAKSFTAGTEQLCVRIPFTKAEVGAAVGRTELSIAAIADPAMALAMLEAMPQPENYADAAAALSAKAQKMRRRRAEAKAHQRNVRKGKKQ